MYNLVKESSIYYKEIMQGEGYREQIIDPLLLITDIEIYNKSKENNTESYKNLCDIICKMRDLYHTGDNKYHAFGNFLREVENAGFDINSIKIQNITKKSKLNDQIELIRMLMCFKYCPY